MAQPAFEPTMVDLRSELEDEDFQMNCLRMDPVSRLTYEDMSALGRATEETIDDALSLLEKFLQRVTDIDGVFRSFKTTWSWQLTSWP